MQIEDTKLTENNEMGVWSRIGNIIFEPSKVFKSVEESPKVLLVVLLILIIGTVLSVLIIPEVLEYTSEYSYNLYSSDAFLEQNPSMNEAAIESTVKLQVNITKYASMAGGLIVLVYLLIQATAYNLVFKIFGGKGNFKLTFAVFAYATLIKLIGEAVKTVNVMLTGDINTTNSLGLLLNGDSTNYLYNVINKIDIFSIWALVTAAIGMAIVHKVSNKKGYMLVFSTWIIYILIACVYTTYQATTLYNQYGILM